MSVKRNVALSWDCAGCRTRLRIEYATEPHRTGAMGTVDCPVCGASKMIPELAERIYYLKDGQWVESKPRSAYI